MLHFRESGEVVIPHAGDCLLFQLESGTLKYERPGSELIVWHSGDDKILLPRTITLECFFAIAETIGEMFGLSAFIRNEALEANMKGRYWAVQFLS